MEDENILKSLSERRHRSVSEIIGKESWYAGERWAWGSDN